MSSIVEIEDFCEFDLIPTFHKIENQRSSLGNSLDDSIILSELLFNDPAVLIEPLTEIEIETAVMEDTTTIIESPEPERPKEEPNFVFLTPGPVKKKRKTVSLVSRCYDSDEDSENTEPIPNVSLKECEDNKIVSPSNKAGYPESLPVIKIMKHVFSPPVKWKNSKSYKKFPFPIRGVSARRPNCLDVPDRQSEYSKAKKVCNNLTITTESDDNVKVENATEQFSVEICHVSPVDIADWELDSNDELCNWDEILKKESKNEMEMSSESRDSNTKAPLKDSSCINQMDSKEDDIVTGVNSTISDSESGKTTGREDD